MCVCAYTCMSYMFLRVEELFRQMDVDDSGAVNREEALAFFKGAFGKMSVDAMFNEA